MKKDQKQYIVSLPEIFFSEEDNSPFKNCMVCKCNLLENKTEYVIEKAVKQFKDYTATDTIFEYAICMKCHAEFIKSYSDSSMENIQNYFLENLRFNPQREALKRKLVEKGEFNISEWTDKCIIKGTPVSELKEYQIGCQCAGDKMLVTGMPFIIGDEAMDEISQLLSNKTIDQMNGFIDDFLGLPPDLRKLIPDSPVMVI